MLRLAKAGPRPQVPVVLLTPLVVDDLEVNNCGDPKDDNKDGGQIDAECVHPAPAYGTEL